MIISMNSASTSAQNARQLQQHLQHEHTAHRTADFLAARGAHIRNASASNLAAAYAYDDQPPVTSNPFHRSDGVTDEYYIQQQHQKQQQQQQQLAAYLKQSKSRGGSQRDLSQFEQHEAAFRVSVPMPDLRVSHAYSYESSEYVRVCTPRVIQNSIDHNRNRTCRR